MSAGIQIRKLETTGGPKTPHNAESARKASRDNRGLQEVVKSSESKQRTTKYRQLLLQIDKAAVGSKENGIGADNEGWVDSQLVLPHQV